MTPRRKPPTKTLTAEQAQLIREARVYEAMAKFCGVGTRSGITMTVSSGRKSATITPEDAPRMVASAKKIAAALRAKASEPTP